MLAQADKTNTIQNIFESPFNNLRWRELLTRVARTVDSENIGLEVISPFGFETLQNTRFLSRALRKFYCYVGIPKASHYSLSVIARQFREELFSQLGSEALENIAIVVEQEQFIRLKEPNYICKSTDKLIDIQCRFVDDSIMDDYAKYVICCLDAIESNKDEAKEFYVNKRHRVRTYQLYMMIEGVLGHLTPKMQSKQLDLYKLIPSRISNSLDIFYKEELLFQPADAVDSEIMLLLIKPRVAEIYESIVARTEKDNIVVDCTSYHVSDSLKITISQRHYEEAINLIRDTYINFV